MWEEILTSFVQQSFNICHMYYCAACVIYVVHLWIMGFNENNYLISLMFFHTYVFGKHKQVFLSTRYLFGIKYFSYIFLDKLCICYSYALLGFDLLATHICMYCCVIVVLCSSSELGIVYWFNSNKYFLGKFRIILQRYNGIK